MLVASQMESFKEEIIIMIPNLVRKSVFEMRGKEERQEDPATPLSDRQFNPLRPGVETPVSSLRETIDIRIVEPSGCPPADPKLLVEKRT